MKPFDQYLFKMLLLLLCSLNALSLSAGEAGESDARFAEKANLALREIAHRMLLVNGDSTTHIPPVHVSQEERRFTIQFKGALRYDTLRAIVDASLANFELPQTYDLAIYDCLNEALILGFAARADSQGEAYPCQEREPVTPCVNMALIFPGKTNFFALSSRWILFSLLLLLSGAAVFWRRKKQRKKTQGDPIAQKTATALLHVGAITLNPQEQYLIVKGGRKKLTYRETKLLHFFCKNPNEVLPREQILETVWGEEGVQVSRSLDVFVSRLRKILREEERVEISSIHGVGYRLKVETQPKYAPQGGFRWPNSLLNHFR